MSVLFWIGALMMTAGGFLLASRPLWRDRDAAPPTAAHDVSVYKSQLAEIDRDLARGALSEAEAEGARREIARRLLAADEAMARESAFPPAPEPAARFGLLSVFAPCVLAAVAVYAVIGAPYRPDAPFAERDLRAERSAALLTQAEAEARTRAFRPAPPPIDAESRELIRRMEAALESRPTDPEGRVLLARAYLGLQRPELAWPLLARAVELDDGGASPQLFAQLGEAMMLAAGGYVSREAEAVFARAPSQSISRYMLGVAESQRGDYRAALGRWTALYVDRRDAPFAADLLAQITGAARALNLDVDALLARLGAPGSTPAPTAPGPDAEQVAEAQRMTPEERQAMIESMVSGLAARLEAEPDDLDGWLRLVRAYGVLGRQAELATALADARKAFAGDDEALARLAAAEQALGEAAQP